jgi:mannosyl-oligosaccharide alpha-1,2-mannosidase
MLLTYVIAFLVLTLAQNSVAAPVSEPVRKKDIQYRYEPLRANAVKDAFQFAWDGYEKYAFPSDELHPLSKGKGNSRYCQ